MTDSFDEVIEYVRLHPKMIVVDDYELSFCRSKGSQKIFQDGKILENRGEEENCVTLRVIHRKQPGCAAVTGLEKESIQHLIENAFASSSLSSPNPWFRFPIWKANTILSKSVENPGGVPEEMNTLIPDFSSAHSSVIENYAVEDTHLEIIRKTERTHLSYQKKIHRFSFRVLAQCQGTRTLLKEEHARRALCLEEQKKTLARVLKLSEAITQAERFSRSGKFPLLFSPLAAAQMVQEIFPWFYSDRILSRKSPFSENRPRFSSKISLVDDGCYFDSPYSDPFDCEGVPSQKTELIKEGKIVGTLSDTETATRDNRVSTGNFVRTHRRYPPSIGVTTAYIEPGEGNFAEFVRNISHGIALESIQSIHWEKGSRCILSGCGWLIDSGSILPQIGIRFAFNPLELFCRAASVGKDLIIFDHFGSPSILFEEMPLEA